MTFSVQVGLPNLDYRADLTRCETIIERGLDTFVEVGAALLEIRNKRLYRDTHGTFEEYCGERWQLGRSSAYRLIDTVRITKSLSPNGDIPMPTKESQVRPLAQLKPEEQREAWKQAVLESNGQVPTAATVRKVANRFLEEVDFERRKRATAQFEKRKRERAQEPTVVTNQLNNPFLIQERQNKERETKLRHQLGIQLIDAGYKVLATKHHPDKGGSPEAMSRLNAVRDISKEAIATAFQSCTSVSNSRRNNVKSRTVDGTIVN